MRPLDLYGGFSHAGSNNILNTLSFSQGTATCNVLDSIFQREFLLVCHFSFMRIETLHFGETLQLWLRQRSTGRYSRSFKVSLMSNGRSS